MAKTLTREDYERAALALNVEVPVIEAVKDIESNGGGFLPSGKCKILFEAKWFHNLTDGKFDRKHPNISTAVWNRKLYKGGEREYDRLKEALALDKHAALMSASYGLFQIMGFNYKKCGFDDIESYVAAMNTNEGVQLDAFVQYIESEHLDDELRNHKWAAFAFLYNGPGYKQNRYDTKLAHAFDVNYRDEPEEEYEEPQQLKNGEVMPAVEIQDEASTASGSGAIDAGGTSSQPPAPSTVTETIKTAVPGEIVETAKIVEKGIAPTTTGGSFIQASIGSAKRFLNWSISLGVTVGTLFFGAFEFIKSNPMLAAVIVLVALVVIAIIFIVYNHTQKELDLKRMEIASKPELNNVK